MLLSAALLAESKHGEQKLGKHKFGPQWNHWLRRPGNWWARDNFARTLVKRVLHISTSAASRTSDTNLQFSHWSAMLFGRYTSNKDVRCDEHCRRRNATGECRDRSAWHARNRACAAINKLMARYSLTDCVFHSCFSRHAIGAWATGPIMLALTDYMTATNERAFTPIIDGFFKMHSEWVLMTFLGAPPDYTADDQLWHAVAYLSYFGRVSHDPAHLAQAKSVFDSVMALEEESKWRTERACRGGLYWHNKPGRHRNVVTNALAIEAAARLSTATRTGRQHRRRWPRANETARREEQLADLQVRLLEKKTIAATPMQLRAGAAKTSRRAAPAVTNYSALAWELWEWLVRSKGVSSTAAVADALLDSRDETRCDRPIVHNWTYMAGTVLSAITALYHDSGNSSLLWWGVRIANISLRQYAGPRGILVEAAIRGSRNPPIYKGVFIHGLSTFTRTLARTQPAVAARFSTFICRNARSAYKHAQLDDEYSSYWTGPVSRQAVPCQMFEPNLKRWFPHEEGPTRGFQGDGKDRTPRTTNGSIVWHDPRLCGVRPGMPPQQTAAVFLLSAALKHCSKRQLRDIFAT